ncbi:MAG: hypothetical protein GF411_15145 [Candidatus Lokiarchaeota archaeon]|nr:hypothetical protein [Candidatus Lokiarchaeota archaeon]
MKKFRDILHMNVDPNNMTFEECASGLTAKYDKKLLHEYLPRTSGVLSADKLLVHTLGGMLPDDIVAALNKTEFVGVFGRVLKQDRVNGITCLQYLYVWDYQAVPAHEADYEPIFVFLDRSGNHAVYDLVHYCSRRLDVTEKKGMKPGFRMIPGWHSFLPEGNMSDEAVDRDLEVRPLTDAHLQAWWNIEDHEPRLKIVNYLLNPFIIKAPGHFMDTPDEESKTMCCAFLEIERALAEFDDPRQAIVEGIKRAFNKCVGIFALHRLGAFVKLLMEMNQVGMIRLPESFREGINLASINDLLRGGFVSLTKFGQSVVEGFQRTQDDDL